MRVACWSLLYVAAGCVETPTTPSINVSGRTFDVVMIDGNALPAPALLLTFRPPCTPGRIARSEMRFLSDGSFEHITWTDTQSPTSDGSLYRSSYRGRSDSFIDISDEQAVGRLAGDTLYLRLTGHFTCQTNRWVAVTRNTAR